MPANKPLEWNMEELVKLRMLHDSRLSSGYTFRHWDEKGRTGLENISIKATKGEANLEGVKGYNVNVSLTFETTTLSSASADTLSLAISDCMFKADNTFAPNLPDLYFVSLEPGTDTARVDTKRLRKRVVTFTFIAKLID